MLVSLWMVVVDNGNEVVVVGNVDGIECLNVLMGLEVRSGNVSVCRASLSTSEADVMATKNMKYLSRLTCNAQSRLCFVAGNLYLRLRGLWSFSLGLCTQVQVR